MVTRASVATEVAQRCVAFSALMPHGSISLERSVGPFRGSASQGMLHLFVSLLPSRLRTYCMPWRVDH